MADSGNTFGESGTGNRLREGVAISGACHIGIVFRVMIVLAMLGQGASVVLAQPVHNLTQDRDFFTIQAAIDAATDLDEIEVDPGTYVENIDFGVLDITVRSTDPLSLAIVNATIIDGDDLGTVVILSAGEISGFTITNGFQKGSNAGGVRATGTAVVSYNMIIANETAIDGGGVIAKNTAQVRNNRVVSNTAGARCGGICADDSSLIIDNYVAYNSAETGGGGIRAQDNCTVRNNTLVFNSSADSGALGGGGILAQDSASLFNNIVAFTLKGTGIHVPPRASVTANYNCVFNNAGGNYGGQAAPGDNDLVEIDPLFFDDYLHLQTASPCVNAGLAGSTLPGETDIDGQNRIQIEKYPVDIGADEIGDCNGNLIPDDLDIEEGTSQDCNANLMPDDCEIDVGVSQDCNENAIPDECDIAGGASEDTEPKNGVPDECELVWNLTQDDRYPDIQSAIDAALEGDEIEVSAETYFENVDFLDKDITLRSTDPLDPVVVAATIINGGGLDTVVTLSAGVISGFTITNGGNTGGNAGGVQASGAAVVSHNIITRNVADEKGGGVIAKDVTLVRNNFIESNTAGDRSGGVHGRDNSVIIDNYIAHNSATSAGGGAGAQENCTIRNNTIVFNSSRDTGGGSQGGGGILAVESAVILNNVIAFSEDGVGIHLEDPGGQVTADYNCVFGNFDGDYGGDAVAGANDLNDDPLLKVDDRHLTLASPCIDAGDPDLMPVDGELDIDGEDRVYVCRVDIGADEAIDCNGNEVPDDVDIEDETSQDCNRSGIPDECEIACGHSKDADGDGIPDECAIPKFFSDWTGAGDSVSWDVEANWDPMRVPNNVPVSDECPDPEIPDSCGALYCVTIRPDEAVVVIAPLFDVTIETLEIGSDLEVNELELPGEFDLTVNESTTIAFGGQLSLGQGASLSGGLVTIQSNGVLATTIDGGNFRFINADLDNSGTLHISGNQFLELSKGFELVNRPGRPGRPGGVIEVETGAKLTVLSDSVMQEGEMVFTSVADIVFANALTNSPGGVISLTGSSLGVTEGLINECDATVILAGVGTQIDGDVTNNGTLTLANHTLINGNLTVRTCGEFFADGDFSLSANNLFIEGGLMSLTGEGQSNGIDADSLYISEKGGDNGLVEVAGDVELLISGSVVIESGGSYQAVADAEKPVAAVLEADTVTVLSGGAFRLTDEMTAVVAGDFLVDGTLALCAPGSRSGKTPPIMVIQTGFTVDGDIIMMGTTEITFDPTADPKVGVGLLLGGDFTNESTCPEKFDWLNGALTLNDSGVHSLEAAGEDRGPYPLGFEDNFAMGTVELAAGAVVNVVDLFSNQQDDRTDCDEVLYVDTLIVQEDAELVTNGCGKVYYNTLKNSGTILGLGVLQVIICEGDANGDGLVDPLDSGFVLARFGCDVGTGDSSCDTADMNGDGLVDPLDVGYVLARFGQCQ